jgi:hypothetical protein
MTALTIIFFIIFALSLVTLFTRMDSRDAQVLYGLLLIILGGLGTAMGIVSFCQ